MEKVYNDLFYRGHRAKYENIIGSFMGLFAAGFGNFMQRKPVHSRKTNTIILPNLTWYTWYLIHTYMIHDALWKVEALSLDVHPSLSFPMLVDSVLECVRRGSVYDMRRKMIPVVHYPLREEVFPYIQPRPLLVQFQNVTSQMRIHLSLKQDCVLDLFLSCQ